MIREGLRRELTAAGFEVVTAVDGSEALQLARGQRFDAISTDVMMPKMDGYELARALRKEPRYQTPDRDGHQQGREHRHAARSRCRRRCVSDQTH